MIGHYLRSALVRFLKAPFTTGANILTLALGLACFIAAWGIVQWWQGADTQDAAAARTFVVGQSLTRSAEPTDGPLRPESTATLAKYLQQEFPQIETIARAFRADQVSVAAGANRVLVDGAVADPSFLAIFDFEFIAGDAVTALAAPSDIVLGHAMAERLFGSAAAALGQRVILDNDREAVVSGVIAPRRQPSFMGGGPAAVLPLDFIANWSGWPAGVARDAQDNWRTMNAMTFVALVPGASAGDFNAQLGGFVLRRMPDADRDVLRMTLTAFPVGEVTRRALDNALLAGSGTGITAASVLLGLGALILIIACVNYANLAVAQAAARAREVGLRKTLGAGRAQIMIQAWLEAAVLTGVATMCALLVIALVAPVVRVRTGIELLHFLSHGALSTGNLAVLVAAVAFLAGAWPALVLSGLRPASVLRPRGAGGNIRHLARVLVALQFASASFLLILVLVSHMQRSDARRTALAALDDPVLVLNDIRPLGIDVGTLRAELERQPGIGNVTVTWAPPWSGGRSGTVLQRTPDAAAGGPEGYWTIVGFDYFETLGLRVLAGRSFDRVRDAAHADWSRFDPAQTRPIVIDDAYAARLGFTRPEDAVDQVLYIPRGPGFVQTQRIVGVTESETWGVQAGQTAGSVYGLGEPAPYEGVIPMIRISGTDVPQTLASVTRVWNQLAPNAALDIRFYDQMFVRAYRQFTQAAQVFLLLAGAAFLIASTGLVGIVVHVAARRRREIGVRKTLGATRGRVLRMLVADFSKPVLVGSLAAWPFAWMVARSYLQNFAERTPLTPIPFLLSLAITLAIAWVAVGGQAWRAAGVKPALVLRAE